MIVGADIRVGAVLHAESLGDSAELYEAELLVEVTRVDIRLHHSVELQYAEALMLSLFEAVLDELLADVPPADVAAFDRVLSAVYHGLDAKWREILAARDKSRSEA